MVMINDEKIENEIKDLLDSRMYKSAHDIKIQCRDGYVTLFGFVDNLGEKNTAAELTKLVEGVKSVENCLTVSTDGTLTDKECEAEVMSKIKDIPDIADVGVKVQKGVAVLEGTVKTLRDKNLAIHQASKAFGVKDVVSHIEISSLKEVDDVSIHNRIQMEYKNSPIQDGDIKTEVHDGKVTLSGFVNTFDDMETALEIAERVEGVRSVKNLIKTRN